MDDRGEPTQLDPAVVMSHLLRARDAQLGVALEQIEAQRETLAAAHDALNQARQDAHRAIRQLGSAYVAAGDQPPEELLRELYWEYPEVKADEIYKAFGMRHVAELAELVGPDERPLPCAGGCGRSVVRRRKNRTDTAPGRAGRQTRLCDECRQEAEQVLADQLQARADVQRRHDEYDQRALEELQKALAGGATPVSTFVEFPGVPGTWEQLADGRYEKVF